MKQLFLILAIFLLPLAANAVNPGEILKDPVLEKRARAISKGLRCVVCQNQSIDDSDAQLARDLRVLVREQLVAGDSDQAVVDYVVSRYGDFVLLRPPVKAATLVLWFGPVVIALIGAMGLVLFFRRQKRYAAEINKEVGE
ncbi:MAG TPA: cytochrome c-type biogenesis protein [Rhodospirillales bacterium]|jgi:cytochrome c-type biogenesis protein CcmH|nr:cytochrome c-type biogenesis protein CcmH [Rhodospirillales bacterium]MDP7424158.1 cytochrome c-type biogenesis protein CcmH [Rhodospirillales bacterium]MDP7623843.1 cytochrome c-type biogenesis protein CcmH [Rhodospirillales bacterium]HJO86924.1 cytochrome c-type biogenesis protein [Rhodospirillales bacterium]|tara:strand:+ start:542 stop:964 length:423 start_codon:yes stop_codon:yes gene_type:complete